MAKTITFPPIMSGKIKCPTCQGGAVAMFVTDPGPIFHKVRKYLLPCQHVLSQEQEDTIVTDMLKKGL